MTIRSPWLLALAGAAWACQAKPPDPQDPKPVAERAIHNTLNKSFQTKFKARLAAPQGDPIDYQGTSLRLAEGVLYIHYTATGGDLKNIVRVDAPAAAPKIWVWHETVGDWVTPEEIGSPGTGRGIQNPGEVLKTLSHHLEGARFLSPGVVEIPYSGEVLEKIMKDQARAGAFDWKESKAVIELHVDAEGRLKKLVCRADLKSADAEIKGSVKYSSEVEVETYSPEREMKFLDDARKAIPLTGDIRKAIDSALKENK